MNNNTDISLCDGSGPMAQGGDWIFPDGNRTNV